MIFSMNITILVVSMTKMALIGGDQGNSGVQWIQSPPGVCAYEEKSNWANWAN